MRQPVFDQGGDAGIAENNLIEAFRGRIAGISRTDVGVEEHAHARNRTREGVDDVRWAQPLLYVRRIAWEKREFAPDLFKQAPKASL